MKKIGLINVHKSLYSEYLFGEGIVIGEVDGYELTGLDVVLPGDLINYDLKNVQNILVDVKHLYLVTRVEDQLPKDVVVWIIGSSIVDTDHIVALLSKGYYTYTYTGKCDWMHKVSEMKYIRRLFPSIVKSEECYLLYTCFLDPSDRDVTAMVSKLEDGTIVRKQQVLSSKQMRVMIETSTFTRNMDKVWLSSFRHLMDI